ncbi:MAG: YbhB/YbcL family Raf kinase inhibitor-like protein [Candidatus Hodarchaeales archaeon]
MKIVSSAFNHSERIPGQFGFGDLDENKNFKMSSNINPAFSWSEVPEGTKSFVLICVDDKVPSKPDNVNKEGLTVSKDLPRVDFYHWVLVDIPGDLNDIKEGEFSNSITARGKQDKTAAFETRQGLNNYTDWFKGDKDMEGSYHGYDGPCPPWNDELIHEYHFKLYALDVESLNLPDPFGGPDVLKAMEGHILDQATITGMYTLNKELY